jgi:hypothetical protein
MKTLSPFALRLRRSILLGLVLAFGASAGSQAQGPAPDRLRTTASTGVFTLLPRQIVRLHLVDTGRPDALSSTARVELRDDRGTLLGFRTTTTLRPGSPLHLVLRSANLLGSRPSLYVRAVAVIEGAIENPLSGPVFSVEFQPDSAGSLPNLPLTVAQCPVHEGGDTTHPPFEHSCGGGGCDVTRELFLADAR